MLHGQRQHADVDLARAQALQQRLGLVFVEHQLQSRQLALQSPRDVRQQVRPHRGNQRELDLSRQRVAIGPGNFHDRIGFLQHDTRTSHDLFAGLGQCHASGLSFDERHAEVFLELANLRRKRRLADETFRGGLAEVSLIGERDEVA